MKINMEAPFNVTSYGYVSCFALQELMKLGHDVHITPISNVMAEQRFGPDIMGTIEKPFHYDAINLKIWHQHNLQKYIGRGPSVGFTIFELEQFNEQERHSLGFPDHLFVCSDWARGVLMEQCPLRSPDTVHVVPLGIDPGLFKPMESMVRDRTIFLNAGKWELRKGHDVLLEAFIDAFTPDDDVELWLMPHNFFLTPEKVAEWVDYYKHSVLGDKVKIINRLEDQAQVYSTLAMAHCGVFPSRAEGWNLELLEMMAIGKPVIATNCTAHTEFCSQDNAMLIEMDEKELAFDGQFFNGQGEWYDFGGEQIEQLSWYLKLVHNKRSNGELEVNQVGIETGEKYTWENMAKRMDSLFHTM